MDKVIGKKEHPAAAILLLSCLGRRDNENVMSERLSYQYHPSADVGKEEGKNQMIKGVRIPPEGISLEKVEEALIREALRMTDGNQTKAARLLDISRDSLRSRMHKFGINRSVCVAFREEYAHGSSTAGDPVDADCGCFFERLAEHANNQDRRGFERKPMNCRACIGEDRSRTGEFAMGTVLDISIGGVRFSIPKDKKLEIGINGETVELSISFTLPNTHWPIGVRCRPKRIVESTDEVQIGAAFVDTDIRSYHALRQHLS